MRIGLLTGASGAVVELHALIRELIQAKALAFGLSHRTIVIDVTGLSYEKSQSRQGLHNPTIREFISHDDVANSI